MGGIQNVRKTEEGEKDWEGGTHMQSTYKA